MCILLIYWHNARLYIYWCKLIISQFELVNWKFVISNVKINVIELSCQGNCLWENRSTMFNVFVFCAIYRALGHFISFFCLCRLGRNSNDFFHMYQEHVCQSYWFIIYMTLILCVTWMSNLIKKQKTQIWVLTHCMKYLHTNLIVRLEQLSVKTM